MKKNIFKIILFLSILLVLLIGLNFIFMKGLRKSRYKMFAAWNDVVDGKVNADIIVLGSSRALVQFDPAIIGSVMKQSCYVLGVDGNTITVQFPMLKVYLNHNKPPKTLIQVLGIGELEKELIYEPFQFIPYLNEKELFNRLALLDKEFYKHKYVPLYGFIMFKEYLWEPVREGLQNKDYNSFGKRTNGFWANDQKWDNAFEEFKKKYPNGRTMGISENNLKDVKEMIKICQKNGTQYVLVFPPAYYEATAMFKNKEEVLAIYRGLAAQYKFPFIDYSDSFLTKSTEYFYNSQHLNKRGATLFSEIFANDLVKIYGGK